MPLPWAKDYNRHAYQWLAAPLEADGFHAKLARIPVDDVVASIQKAWLRRFGGSNPDGKNVKPLMGKANMKNPVEWYIIYKLWGISPVSIYFWYQVEYPTRIMACHEKARS